MRSGYILCIIVASTLLLQGCGRKGPLKLPAPQVQSPSQQTPSSR